MFLSRGELLKMGLLNLGENVQISDKASIYRPTKISIGSNVRIDDFCILSPGEDGIELHSYIHISCYSALIGKGKITIEDYGIISSRVLVYSSNDNYGGEYLMGPMVDPLYTNVHVAPVTIKRYAAIGSSSIILPGVTLHEGAVVGAHSLVKKDVDGWCVFGGVPAKFLKKRSDKLLNHIGLLNEREKR
ncbi:MAG: acyltransferase [Candidatus Omnitrophota bacterium]